MFPYSFANEVAQDFLAEISHTCLRTEIAGSLRRCRPYVNDIDIVAIPKKVEANDESLFGERIMEDVLDVRILDLTNTGQLRVEVNGSKLKRYSREVDGERISIDLYIASEETWWTILLIRIGSRDHNIKLARRAIELHMALKADGSGLLTAGGSLIPIHSEEDIFRHLEIPYRTPRERE